MAEEKVFAFSGDIVQLNGTRKKGRVLDWSTQLPIDQRQHAETLYPVQPIDAGGRDAGDRVFWPQHAITVVTRNIVTEPRPDPEFDIRF